VHKGFKVGAESPGGRCKTNNDGATDEEPLKRTADQKLRIRRCSSDTVQLNLCGIVRPPTGI